MRDFTAEETQTLVDPNAKGSLPIKNPLLERSCCKRKTTREITLLEILQLKISHNKRSPCSKDPTTKEIPLLEHPTAKE